MAIIAATIVEVTAIVVAEIIVAMIAIRVDQIVVETMRISRIVRTEGQIIHLTGIAQIEDKVTHPMEIARIGGLEIRVDRAMAVATETAATTDEVAEVAETEIRKAEDNAVPVAAVAKADVVDAPNVSADRFLPIGPRT